MNIIESYTGSLFHWSDTVINNGISAPIFMWLESLINAIIKFRPVFLVGAFFCLFLGFIYGLGKSRKNKKNKDLSNK